MSDAPMSIPVKFVMAVLFILLVGIVIIGSFVAFSDYTGTPPTLIQLTQVAIVLLIAGGSPAYFLYWYLHRGEEDELEYEFDDEDETEQVCATIVGKDDDE